MNISGGIYKGRKVITPDESITRPTLSKVRMGVFNSLYSILGDFKNMTFLDVFGGSGIMGLEAISRGFKSSTVIEIDKKSANIIKNNYTLLGLKPDLIIGNSLNIIPKLKNKYNVAYVDPPYYEGLYNQIIECVKTKADIIIIEHPKNENIMVNNIIKQKKYGDKIITYLR